MNTLQELLPDSASIARDVPEDQRMAWETVPAKGAVYLLVSGEEGTEKPMLLATVGDLRAAIRRRLSDAPPDAKTRRVDYARLCTRLYWRRVDSSLAANAWYWRTARALFPLTYPALIPWRATWFIGVESEGPHPKLRRTTDLSQATLCYAGPVRDKQAAGKLIETVEDLFDLCRYHAELVQAPHGRACAYKEMGKCPAPCDGSVPLSWYRRQMDRAWEFLRGDTRETWRQEVEIAMRAAAAQQEFELANRLKQRLARGAILEGRGAESFRQVQPLERFSFIALQPGQGKPWIEPWLIHGGHIEALPQIHRKTLPAAWDGVLARYTERARVAIAPPLDSAAIEQIALAAHHLFRGEEDHGIFVRGTEVSESGAAALAAAAEALFARKRAPKPLVEQSSEPAQVEPAKVEISPASGDITT